MQVSLFDKRDVLQFELQPRQAHAFSTKAEWQTRAQQLASYGSAYSLKRDDNSVAAICGLYPVDPGHAMAWAFLGHGLKAEMVSVTRIIKRYLDTAMIDHRRIAMSVHAEFEQGLRWAEMLGFESEGCERMAAADRGDLIRYVRLNGAV